MKNMNNKKLFAVLAAVTVLFASCNNGLQTKNSEHPEGKARISFRINDVSKSMTSNTIGWDDIKKIVIKVKKYYTLDDGEADSTRDPYDYCDDLFWMTTTDSVTNEISTAYEKLQTYEQEFDLGWYKFDLELYLDSSGTKQCFYGGTMKSLITSSTTQLSFRAVPTGTGTGDLKVKFCWDYYPALPESADNLPILYMEAGLYSDLACTEAVTGSELEKDLQEDYSDALTFYNNNWNYLDDDERDPDNAPPYEISWNYEVQSIPIGTYYLKYSVYYANPAGYDQQTGDPLYDYIKLNSFVEKVEINQLGIDETREFEQDDVNKIPVIKGGFIFDSTLIDIECDSDNSDSDFYLNNGTITLRVKDHDTKEFINQNNVSVELYYGSQRVDASYYSFGGTQTGTYGQPGFDYVFQFKLKEDKPLLTSGKYQLSIIATKPASASANTSGPFFYSARTIDLDVKPQVYFEFDAGGYYSATELGLEMKTRLNNLRNDAIIRVYGTPYSTTSDVEVRNMEGGTDSVDTAQGYFDKIASTLEEMVKNNLVDLDMSELDNVYTMDLPNYDSTDYFDYGITCNCLKSIKLPASLHNIPKYSIWEAANLKTIEFTIGENCYDRYDIAFWPRAFKNVPALEQFIITNKTTEETNLVTCDNGKLLLSKIDDSTASVVGSVSAVEQFTIPSTGDISVTRIDDYAFYGSKATTVTGLNTVKEIGFHAFEKSYITTLTGLSAVEVIQDYAFCDSKITAIPDLSHLTQSPGSGAFKNCTNLQTITVDESFLNVINSNNVTFDTFDNCVTQNLVIDINFNLAYSGSAYSMPGTSYGSKLKILDDFKVADTLTFNKEVTLPDISYSNDLLNDVSTVQFFYNSRGSSSSSGLKHVVFKQKSYIGAAQFGKFVYLESIVFEDELNQCASEIGKQAFWVNPENYKSDSFQTTRSANDIILTGVIRISFNAINICNAGGTLNVPSTLIAVNQDAFKGITTEGQNAVTPVLNFPAGGMWVKASSLNTAYGNTETTIKEWLQSNQSELTITAQDGVAGTDAENPGTPKIEINVDVPDFEHLSINGTGNYDHQEWYYHLSSN